MTRLFSPRKLLLSAALGLLILGIGIVVLLLRNSPSPEFALRSMGVTSDGPEAIFQRERLRLPWIVPNSFGIGFQTRLWVLRHKQWIELPLSEIQNIVQFENNIRESRNRTRNGYTVTVKVPICERWKIETEIGETKRLGWKALSLRFTSTNRWQSAELPGWSIVHNQFQSVATVSQKSPQLTRE